MSHSRDTGGRGTPIIEPIIGDFLSVLTELVISKPDFILYKHTNSCPSFSRQVLPVTILSSFYNDKLMAVGVTWLAWVVSGQAGLAGSILSYLVLVEEEQSGDDIS